MSDLKQGGKSQPIINSIRELLAHALALEIEAVARYTELADIMATHNNQEVAALFRKMSQIEKLHVETIHEQIDHRQLKRLPVIKYQWTTAESPETTDLADLHYLMTPKQALTLALVNERRARDYYQAILQTAADRDTRVLAEELAVEEEEHVALLLTWLEKIPATEDNWDYDDDLPSTQD